MSLGETDRIRLAAVGDLLLSCDPSGKYPPRNINHAMSKIKSIWSQCDIVLGNLECTLGGQGELIASEPRVISNEQMVKAIKPAGINIVTLANNHMFDAKYGGFQQVKVLLEKMNVSFCGAGENLKRALSPAVLEIKGIRLAFIGAADRRCGAAHFAYDDNWGVAPLDIDLIKEHISQLRREVDHVIVTVHWGEERFRIPSPIQVQQAHALVDAGASMILGHHPHVLQGLEIYQESPIIYSMGNFIANDVYYVNGDILFWNRTERTGCILFAEIDSKKVHVLKQIPSYDSGEFIAIDNTNYGTKRISLVNHLVSKRITLTKYRLEYLRVKIVKPIFGYIRWSRLKTLRLRQIKNALLGVIRTLKAK